MMYLHGIKISSAVGNIEGEFTVNVDDGKSSSLTAKGDGLILTIMVIESDDEGTIITQSVTEE